MYAVKMTLFLSCFVMYFANSSGEAKRALSEEVLQSQKDPGFGAATDPNIWKTDSGGLFYL